MTKNSKWIIIVSVLAMAMPCLYLKGDQTKTEFPQLSSTVNYADIKQRVEWMDNQIKREERFYNLFDSHGLKTVWNVPNYEGRLMFAYKKNENNKFEFGALNAEKDSPNRCFSADIAYHKNGVVGYYCEFSFEFIVRIYYHATQKLKRIEFENDWGERKITFDDKEQITSDDYKWFPEKEIQKRLEINKEIESEIRESIAAGYTDVQKQRPKPWRLRLPAGLKEGDVKDRLTKVGEYHQAIVDGKSDPLADHKLFTEHKNKELRATIHVFFSGKKVSFVGAYTLENWRDLGYFMVFDEYARLTKYVEGEIDFNQNLTGYEVVKTAKLFLRETPSETNRRPSGIEITFHPSGYPSCYRTIVKHRLFGKQMEWDDKGNVISDIDQDIPKALPVAADPRSLSE